jgi:hypothetical protein
MTDPELSCGDRHIRDARRWGFALVAIGLLVLTTSVTARQAKTGAAPEAIKNERSR